MNDRTQATRPVPRSARSATITAFIVLVVQAPGAGQAPGDAAGPGPPPCLISTGVTGRVTASGLDDPQYVLSFEPVQRLVLQAARGGVTRERADTALASVPPTAGDLVRLGLLREDGTTLRLDYLLLTIDDQRRIHEVARGFGRDLGTAFLRRRWAFSDLLRDRPPARRGDLLFGLVAGMVLNWEGLKLTADAGYRGTPGDGGLPYLVHSKECGADLPTEGLYWGSHTYPGRAMAFTTFGDPPSIPRVHGVPDALTVPIEAGIERLAGDPAVHSAVRGVLAAHVSVALEDAGAVTRLLAIEGPLARAAIAERLPVPPARLDPAMELLESTGYVERGDGSYRASVPVLTEADSALVDRAVALGRDVLEVWLEENHPRIRHRLRSLPVVEAGIPFPLVFSEIWHYLFGFAALRLAEAGFYVNPRAERSPRPGYVPLVWSPSLYRLPR